MKPTYLTFSLGRSGPKYSAMQNVDNQYIGARLYVSGRESRKHYKRLVEQRKSIEQELGMLLERSKSFGRSPGRITLRKEMTNLTDAANWLNQFEWLCMNLEKFDKVFRPRILEI